MQLSQLPQPGETFEQHLLRDATFGPTICIVAGSLFYAGILLARIAFQRIAAWHYDWNYERKLREARKLIAADAASNPYKYMPPQHIDCRTSFDPQTDPRIEVFKHGEEVFEDQSEQMKRYNAALEKIGFPPLRHPKYPTHNEQPPTQINPHP